MKLFEMGVLKKSKQELELSLLQYENQFIKRVLLYTTLSTIWFCKRPCLQCAQNPAQTGADLRILKLKSISKFSLLGSTMPENKGEFESIMDSLGTDFKPSLLASTVLSQPIQATEDHGRGIMKFISGTPGQRSILAD